MLNKGFSAKSFLLVGVLCLLVFKLAYTGIILGTAGSVSLDSIWKNRLALADDDAQPEQKVIQDGKGSNRHQQASVQPDAEGGSVALEMKRIQLERRERRLQEERERLMELKQEIDEKLSRITQIQQAVQRDLERKETAQSNRIKHLIKVYQTMPPRKAAVLIDKLDMEVIISLFSQMKGENVGQILPYVSAEKAAEISERLAKIGL